MKSFAELFKKYRLRAEFETFTAFGNVLSEKGYYYEDSIFSHWQKGSRVPSSRHLVLTIIQIFSEKEALKTINEANDILESAGMGYLTKKEVRELHLSQFAVPFQVPSEIVHFTGRDDLVNQVEKEIKKRKVFLLYGSPGVGKTALAIKLGHRFRNKFPDGVLWYKVDSSNIMDILLSIASLYGRDIRSIKDTQVRASIVRTLLSEKKILLILDNVTSHDTISLLLPNNSSCSVIITSQENLRNIAIHYRAILVPAFTQEETFKLFEKIFDKNYVKKHQETIFAVGERLGYLPLAVHIAAHIVSTYIRTAHMSFEAYLQKLEEAPIDLQRLTYEDKNLFRAITIGYKALDQQARNVFISLGVFEGKDFSLEAVTFINKLPLETMESIMIELRRISFIQESSPDRYSMHPLIKIFARKKMHDSFMYLQVAKYYEALLSNYQKDASRFSPFIRQETDNIIYIFKKCYELQYWDPITNLWNQLEQFLQDTKELDKLRPLVERVYQAKKINIFQKILLGYIIFHLFFWICIQMSTLTKGLWNDLFNVSLSILPLYGGFVGLYIAKSWGFLKNSLGKALTCLASGLVCWGMGNAYLSYNDLFTATQHPYPSLADIGFFSSFYLWAIGIFYLSRAAGTRYSTFGKYRKLFFILSPTIVALLSLVLITFFMKDYGLFRGPFFPKMILNVGYAFVLIVMLALSLVIFGLSFGFFGGRYKLPMYSLLIGFIFIYISVAVYYPLLATNNYYNGNWGDFFYTIALSFIAFGVCGFYRLPQKKV